MPTVKPYGALQVETQPIQGGRSAFQSSPSSPVGEALQGIGLQMHREEVQRQDQVAFLEADRKLSEWENTTLYDPKTGALNKRGKDAFGVPDEVLTGFEDYVTEVSKSLNTDKQRDAYNRSVLYRRRDLHTTLSRHVLTESRKFEEAETENYVKNATQAAISNAHDIDRVSIELGRAEAAVRGFATRNGLGDEYVKQKVAQVRSNTHVGIVDRFIASGQDRAAKNYFTTNKGEIAGDDLAAVEAKLKTATTDAEGLRGGADIWKRLGPKGDLAPVQVDKMMAEAEAKYSDEPGVLKAVKAIITERANVHNAAQRERREAHSSAVWKAIESDATLAQVQRMPSYLALPGKEQNDIKTWMSHRTEAQPGDDALFYRLITEASTPALQDQFQRVNLMEHRAKLSRSQFNTLISAQTALRKGDTKEADKILVNEAVQRRIVDDAVLGLGLDPTPNEKYAKTDKGKQVLDFRRVVRDTIRQHEVRNQKQATDEEVQAIVDGLVIKGVTAKRWLFDDTKRVYELKPGESINIKPADVPRAERTKIEEALKRAGRQVTEEAVTTLYTAKLLQMRGTMPQREDDPRKRVPD